MGGHGTQTGDRATVVVACGNAARGDVLGSVLAEGGFEVRVLELDDPSLPAPGEAPDLCLLEIDAGAPGDAIALAERVSEEGGGTKVVILAPDANPDTFLDAMRVGVAGYVVSGPEEQRIVETLWDVLAGQPAVPSRFLRLLIDELQAMEPDSGPRR
jgi:DNA-binding NarL/FixJ family response regulator